MKVLLIVDVQNDFLPGGALAVTDGDQIIPIVNILINKFDFVVATQDWHPENHGSFSINHPGSNIGDTIILNGQDQILWPVHCVQNSKGAGFSEHLRVSGIDQIIKKGTNPDIDSYSGFYDNEHLKSTGLSDFLNENNVVQVYIVGLATDYCIKYTAFDAIEEGFETYVIIDGTRAVNLEPGDFNKAVDQMVIKGIEIIKSVDIA